MTRTLRLMALLLLAVGISGCSAATNRAQRNNDMKQIGIAFVNHCDSYRKGPAKADDLGPFMENDQRLLNLLRSGEIVLIYGVNMLDLSKMTAGSSGTVVGYEKQVPEKGGYVLFGDLSVKDVSAAEFKALPLAKPQGPMTGGTP